MHPLADWQRLRAPPRAPQQSARHSAHVRKPRTRARRAPCVHNHTGQGAPTTHPRAYAAAPARATVAHRRRLRNFAHKRIQPKKNLFGLHTTETVQICILFTARWQWMIALPWWDFAPKARAHMRVPSYQTPPAWQDWIAPSWQRSGRRSCSWAPCVQSGGKAATERGLYVWRRARILIQRGELAGVL